jgi:hypothetical protein
MQYALNILRLSRRTTKVDVQGQRGDSDYDGGDQMQKRVYTLRWHTLGCDPANTPDTLPERITALELWLALLA